MMESVGMGERQELSMRERLVRNTYLVRSLVNGMYYYPLKLAGEEHICATQDPFDIKGFKTHREADAFGARLEKEKHADVCVGHAPYTRVEVKIEKIEVKYDGDDSSASNLI